MKAPAKTILAIRLSSLGDLILSTAFLENLPPGVGVDWVVADPFGFVLEGHPKIRKLYLYQKSTGLLGWIRLMKELSKQNYDARVDLHGTIRSTIATVIFWLGRKSVIRIGKQRIRTSLYFILKSLPPRALRPTPYWTRFALMGHKVQRILGIPQASGSMERLSPPHFPLDLTPDESAAVMREYQLKPKQFIAVMPSSRWASKEWGADRYFQAIAKALSVRSDKSLPILILGREQDKSSVELLEKLKAAGFQTRSALAEEEFRVTAYLISQAILYLGSDTGLAHLAEAVGTNAVMIFGPTQPDVGFGPWRDDSRAIVSSVLCSPCSKDGQPCYRVLQPYECLKRIHANEVAKTIEQQLSKNSGPEVRR